MILGTGGGWKRADTEYRTSLRPYLGGAGANGYRIEIVWHSRETRRPTEKTNINL